MVVDMADIELLGESLHHWANVFTRVNDYTTMGKFLFIEYGITDISLYKECGSGSLWLKGDYLTFR